MIARTRIAGEDPGAATARRRSGSSRSTLCSNGSTCVAHDGQSTKIPQRPMTTLGTAASIVDQRPDRAADRRRRELAQEEADRDRERRGDQDRAERGDERPDDELAGAVDVGDGVPGAVPDEARSRSAAIAGHAPGEDLPDDRRDDEQREDRGGRGEAVERPVAERSSRRRVRRRPPAAGGASLRRLPPARTFQAPVRARGRVTTSSREVHILCTPRGWTGRDTRRR